MFENVLGQAAADQLKDDISSARLAPSMLFSGPRGSGKGTAALELARSSSCETSGAPWNCSCSSCARQRLLLHPDLLLFGPKNFSAEISAASSAFLRDPGSAAAQALFVRSVRKLLCRFSPVLWEDDPKFSKLSPLAASLDELLNESLEGISADAADADVLRKSCDGIVKNAVKLEAEGMGDTVPIAQIRRAAYWSRLAPVGKRKTVIIENADRMQEGARNSLLKILEEPPETVNIILTTVHPGALLPTIISRLRPYRFSRREGAVENEVLRRVFRDPDAAGRLSGPDRGEGRISAYLDSFLPVSPETLDPLAAFFAASAAASSIIHLRKKGRPEIPPCIINLGKHAAPLAEKAGLGRPVPEMRQAVLSVMQGAAQFEVRGLFSSFLSRLLNCVSEGMRKESASPSDTVFAEQWISRIREADSAVSIYNQNPASALERLSFEIIHAMGDEIQSPGYFEEYGG